ncbi:aspartoacylase [Prochlorococcus sp. MIT 1341]|uniref:aspartoacylase n=1 Tax=Prochlorococcus sp. MIT 1341 TaxID=3096221 RepID=UPI002A766ADE|nr:aspartoacylase [Prochlorococcus sp. MIT 1341]
MSSLQVLLVAGTHGNEINAPWLFEQWLKRPDLIDVFGLRTVKVLGNPIACQKGKRYLDRDLNRSFSQDLLSDSQCKDIEVRRANELLHLYGKDGVNPCQLVLDCHSTTASMGTSLVVYGRRPSDLALASLIQFRLGLPIYLHEDDSSQQGFLVESWPCGLVLEIGPVAQNLLDPLIIKQTILALEVCLEEISKNLSGQETFPDQIVVHRHLGSLDLPRDSEGSPTACLHECLHGNDWRPIKKGTPLFLHSDGFVERFSDDETVVPVFINEAAYAEKRISMSLTRKESWDIKEPWKRSLQSLLSG